VIVYSRMRKMEKQSWYLLSPVITLAVLLIACGGLPTATLAPTLPSVVTVTPGSVNPRSSTPRSESAWQEEFGIAECPLVPTGRNPYFILEPGFQTVLEGKGTKLVITVLDETKTVDRVNTRVVEEREWKNGELVEVSRNFFAMCERTKDVFYFGEEVDMYSGGKLASHTGAWLAGENNARAGLIMSGQPKVGMRYYQEVAPGIAMDRAEIVSVNDTLKTPAGSFSNCLRIKEGTALDPNEVEYKVHAPGIGLIQEPGILLTKYGQVSPNTPP